MLFNIHRGIPRAFARGIPRCMLNERKKSVAAIGVKGRLVGLLAGF